MSKYDKSLTPVSFTLLPSQLEALRKESYERGMSVSAIVRERLFGSPVAGENERFRDTPEYADILHRLKELESKQIVSRIPATVFDYTASPVSGSPVPPAGSHLDAALAQIAERPSINDIANRQRSIKGFDPDKEDDD